MPSQRRLKLLSIAGLTLLIIILYYNSPFSPSHFTTSTNGHNYSKTRLAPSRHHPQKYLQQLHEMNTLDRQRASDAQGMQSRLKEAEGAAKTKANLKSPGPPPSPNKDTNEAGSIKKTIPSISKQSTTKEKVTAATTPKTTIADDDDEEDDLVLNIDTLLKRSPILIFSKSYCPFSRKAKDILLNKYIIEPAPYVVELDRIPEGWLLQEYLGKWTGRTTVPNVLVNGKSIGGGDDVQDLHRTDRLVELLLKMAGSRFSKVERKGKKM